MCLQINLTDTFITYYNPISHVINCTEAVAKMSFALSHLYPSMKIVQVGSHGILLSGTGIYPLNITLTDTPTVQGTPSCFDTARTPVMPHC